MTKAQEREIMQAALDTYGISRQQDKLIEEMSELTKAILKLRDIAMGADAQPKDLDGVWNNVLEEIADVEIVLEQMKIFHGETFVAEWKEKKLARLAKRLGMGAK